MTDQHTDNNKTAGFNWYVAKRLLIAALLIILIVWAFGSSPKTPLRGGEKTPGSTNTGEERTGAASPSVTGQKAIESDPKSVESNGNTDIVAQKHSNDTDPQATAPSPMLSAKHDPLAAPSQQHTADPEPHAASTPQPAQTDTSSVEQPDPESTPPSHGTTKEPHGDAKIEEGHEPRRDDEATPSKDAAPHEEQDDHKSTHGTPSEPRHEDPPSGVTFVEATMAPINHELNKRFWGWRPNDIVNVTDNVNNFQLGVLEVTRRTVVLLAERISRTGTTDAFNQNLENAMNWLMVKADRYWFPSPESKYKESLDELTAYKEELLQGRGSFYTRTDNLIPLLSSYEDLLGSCDENLVKQTNEDESRVSLFKADDYFFYAKGVASAMATILEAIHHDFHKTVESRHATELLHHALESCRQAAALDPLLITNGDLDGVLANHRANMAAPISHARFYISQLIKTLST